MLQGLPVGASLYFLSKLTAAVTQSDATRNQAQWAVLGATIAQRFKYSILSLLSQGRTFFYPHQIWATMNLVGYWGAVEAKGTPLQKLAPDDVGRLTTGLLAVSGLVDAQRLSGGEDGAKYLLHHWKGIHSEPIPSRLARWRYMLTQSAGGFTEFDPNPAFKSVTGFDTQTYFDAGMELYMGFFSAVQQAFNNGDEILLSHDYFRNEPAALAVLQPFIMDMADFCSTVKNVSGSPNDLLFYARHLQSAPILRYHDRYFCLSLPFLGERISSGAHYLVLDHLPQEDEKKKYMTWLGHVFEDYMVNLLSSVSWTCAPETEPSMADASITSSDGGIIVECKTKRIPVDVFESGSVSRFRDQLRSDTGIRKGASQLSDRFSKIDAGTYPVPELTVESTAGLVCTLESTPAIWQLGEEVDAVFSEFTWPSNTIPAVVSAFDLEMLVSYHELTKRGIKALKEWLPKRNEVTLADFLRSKEPVKWMGTFQNTQWELSKTRAIQLLNAAIQGNSPTDEDAASEQ